MIDAISKILYPVNYSLFSGNKNRFAVDYYIGWKELLVCLAIAAASYSAGSLNIGYTAAGLNHLIFGFVRALIFFCIMAFCEASLIYNCSKIFNIKTDYKILLKSFLLSYLPLVFFAPISVFSENIRGLMFYALVIWMIFLKIKLLKNAYNTGIFNTLIIALSPLILFLTAAFLTALILSSFSLYLIMNFLI